MKKPNRKAQKILHRRREKRRLNRLNKKASGHWHYQSIYHSEIIDYYFQKNSLKKAKRGDLRIGFPKVFSLIENPDESLASINKFISVVKRNSDRKIFIDQKNVEKLDFGAEALLGVLALEAYKRMRFDFLGSFPESEEMQEIVKATGLPKSLGLSFELKNKFLTFHTTHGRKVLPNSPAHKSDEREIVSSDFIKYMNGCLNIHGFELTDEGFDYLGQLVNATIENAEDHSGKNDWWIGGYLRNVEDTAFSDMHIVIFNFGDSIFETLSGIDKESKLGKIIDDTITKNTRSGHFSTNYTEKELWTLLALQQRVSRNNKDHDYISNNGQGTKDIIKFFEDLGESGNPNLSPKMVLLSGNTYIMHDKSYKLREIKNSENSSLGLVFNEDNDLLKKPDLKYIKKLKNYFPGTMYSFRFYLNNDYLTKIVQNENN